MGLCLGMGLLQGARIYYILEGDDISRLSEKSNHRVSISMGCDVISTLRS